MVNRNFSELNNKWFCFSIILILSIIHYVRYSIHNDYHSDQGFYTSSIFAIYEGSLVLPLWGDWAKISDFNFIHGVVNVPFQALCLKILGVDNWYWFFWVSNCIISFFIIYCSFKITRANTNTLLATFIILFLILDPTMFLLIRFLRSDLLLILFFTITVILLYKFVCTEKKRFLFLSGIMTGITILTFVQGASIVVGSSLVLLFHSKEISVKCRNFLLYYLAFFLTMLPFIFLVIFDETIYQAIIMQMHMGTEHKGESNFLTLMKILGTPFSSLLISGRSFTSFFAIAILVRFVIYFKDRDTRFFGLMIISNLVVLAMAHKLNCLRIACIAPISIIGVFLIFKNNYEQMLKYLSFSALIIVLSYMFAYLADPDVFPHLTILSLLIIPIYYFYLRFKETEIHAREIIFLFSIFLVLSAVNITKYQILNTVGKPDVFHKKGVEVISETLEKRFSGDKVTIFVKPNTFKFFPKSINTKTSSLLYHPKYFNYWGSYKKLDESIKPDFIVVPLENYSSMMERPEPREYIEKYFTSEKSIVIDRLITFRVLKRNVLSVEEDIRIELK
ncbi:MAG: hypothetical protein COA79_17185 [Planctomycetota bacterium]|nr:MAG: hypothetical protein COA79_17185 [Planctomycetota bacterium]